MAENQKKRIKIALDSVPFGTPEENELWRTEKKVTLPAGVDNKQILKDTFRIA